MNRNVYRFTFEEKVSMPQVRDSLFLSAVASEAIHGRAQMRLDATFYLDAKERSCVVDSATPIGRTIAQVFAGLLIRELGDDGFAVERVGEMPARAACGGAVPGSTRQVAH